ncbi:hypothetical protein [Bifidobacterium choloepi]|uniref:Uncharacterized protein n=1 Tax=Bifidobacterium choloepi TaxID=2614131 RepID=A0A6I5NAZ7_9BIFI|nr:hypothetical protein [Bifidobacterium choloepi]NEG69630.1 hypothetical protein [Bifidobacterium choloepi]
MWDYIKTAFRENRRRIPGSLSIQTSAILLALMLTVPNLISSVVHWGWHGSVGTMIANAFGFLVCFLLFEIGLFMVQDTADDGTTSRRRWPKKHGAAFQVIVIVVLTAVLTVLALL